MYKNVSTKNTLRVASIAILTVRIINQFRYVCFSNSRFKRS